ncbi:MAG: divalent-cation tolerance protein CutA [Alphaproteobacteria bacterium]|nr:divalent-cation tolerance protein CutA [Alphaproteobacteria bacterium]MBF0129697.1 divalent-cation tolerance protein CutA [Alphaproteobacteria bacterium]
MSQTLVYITAGSHDEALALGRALVEARLAACANVLGAITSVYWWEGKLDQGNEVALIVKTKTSLVDRVVALVGEKHSYDCPCVVALPIENGNPAFLKWIENETL